MIGLALSKGPNRVDASLPTPEDANRTIFQKMSFYSYLEFWKIDRVLQPSNSGYYTPLSEPFRFYFTICGVLGGSW
jgi:hypothetical protein